MMFILFCLSELDCEGNTILDANRTQAMSGVCPRIIIKRSIRFHVSILWVIPCEFTHPKNESLTIVFIHSTQSVHPMRFHNPEYQSPVTSGSRETGCTHFVNPVTREPKVTGG